MNSNIDCRPSAQASSQSQHLHLILSFFIWAFNQPFVTSKAIQLFDADLGRWLRDSIYAWSLLPGWGGLPHILVNNKIDCLLWHCLKIILFSKHFLKGSVFTSITVGPRAPRSRGLLGSLQPAPGHNSLSQSTEAEPSREGTWDALKSPAADAFLPQSSTKIQGKVQSLE